MLFRSDPYLHRRPSNTQRQVWLSLCGVSWCAKGFVLSPLSVWWIWGLILNVVSPLLLSCWGFSFALGHGVSFFGGIQHSPVDDCSVASCNFGVLTGEDERMSFYFAILKAKPHLFIHTHTYIYMLLLLSRFSRVRLCDPIDSSPQGSSVPETGHC